MVLVVVVVVLVVVAVVVRVQTFLWRSSSNHWPMQLEQPLVAKWVALHLVHLWAAARASSKLACTGRLAFVELWASPWTSSGGLSLERNSFSLVRILPTGTGGDGSSPLAWRSLDSAIWRDQKPHDQTSFCWPGGGLASTPSGGSNLSFLATSWATLWQARENSGKESSYSGLQGDAESGRLAVSIV